MRSQYKRILLFLIVISTFFAVGYFLLSKSEVEAPEILDVAEPEFLQKVIGKSAEGRNISAYTYFPLGSSKYGDTHILFVGGIHGGYEWNSVMLAYEMIDYLKKNFKEIPNDIVVTIIPSANPDGVYEVTGRDGRFVFADVPSDEESTIPGRFNANGVDLNRNFDCNWQSESMWRGEVVSAGTDAFSEPESSTIRDFVLKNNPDAVIFWHSKSNSVYASECEEGVLLETIDIMNVYSKASGYSPVESFDAYEITGDAEGWLASLNIPSITVELKTHEDIDWAQNLAGFKAIMGHYSSQ